jgi:hypothetical protein
VPDEPQNGSEPPQLELRKTAIAWRCALCPVQGLAWFAPQAFSALALHVARFHPMALSSLGTITPIDPVCDPDERVQ